MGINNKITKGSVELAMVFSGSQIRSQKVLIANQHQPQRGNYGISGGAGCASL